MQPKPYIEIADFPDLTPFSEAAIRKHMQSGDFVEGVHFWRHGRRVIFKWAAVEQWIEKRAGELTEELGGEPRDVVPLRRHG
jgi:hypothetical protein